MSILMVKIENCFGFGGLGGGYWELIVCLGM